MRFIDRLRGKPGSSEPAQAPSPVLSLHDVGAGPPTYLGGRETLEVVGESNYQDALWAIVGGKRWDPVRHDIRAILEPEPTNVYDSNAVMVKVESRLVGYLCRHDAGLYCLGVQRLIAESKTPVGLYGVVVGGGERRDGLGFLGVFLDHDPRDFGVPHQLAADIPGFRTGFSEAVATDHADDSYDLSWYRGLSRDTIAAIKQLRGLLEHDRDPIDRHYMMCELEERLYKSRDAFDSALAEFDAVCRQHDSEMETIRSALCAKFNKVPVLDTYRQAAIRCQKARDWTTMLFWAERGLCLYGEHAARQEAVDDLAKRQAYASTKLTSSGP